MRNQICVCFSMHHCLSLQLLRSYGSSDHDGNENEIRMKATTGIQCPQVTQSMYSLCIIIMPLLMIGAKL